jgi:trk system potassium uptake protein
VHHTSNFSLRGTRYAASLGIDELICPEHLTAKSIAQTIRNPGMIAIEEFAEGQLLMQRFAVEPDAPAVGKRLADVQLPPGTRVATVDRDGVARLAVAGTVIEADEHVTLIGQTKAFESARRRFTRGAERRSYIVIMGETSTAVWLCRAFRDKAFSVRIFVENHERAEELSEKLEHVTVIEGDPTDATTFADEHVERADAFIAVTAEDERNILGCAQAKRLGVPVVIAVVQRAKYLHLFPHVGIDHAFSPRSDAVKAILHWIDTGPIRSLATFAEGVAEVYEVTPLKRAPIIGHELRNIRMPPESMIAAIRRSERVYVPGADDQIMLGDTVLVIGPRNIGDELAKLFVTK